MNRFVRVVAAAALAVGGVGAVGCVGTGHSAGCTSGGCGVGGGGSGIGGGGLCRTFIDPCYPERYNAVARTEVLAPFAAQVNNGHVLNQTIWNWYFAPGTDQLTEAGRAKLDSLAQTRPGPDARIYLQAARDVVVTPQNESKVGAMRDDVTVKRAASVQRYMNTQPAIGAAVAYEIYVHDPVVPGISAEFATRSYLGQRNGYRGGLTSDSAASIPAPGGGSQQSNVIIAPPPAAGQGGAGVGGGGSVTGSAAGPPPGGP